MSSLSKMLAILGLFTPARPTLSADEIVAKLACSPSSGYRYIRELSKAGLLIGTLGEYGLGPSILELDYHLRECDPILRAAQKAMEPLRSRFYCDVLITVLFGDRVVVTHHERGSQSISVSYGRGHAMPLFRGAPSKAILSGLTPARQRKLFQKHRAEIQDAGMGSDEAAFRANLTSFRRAGFVVSHGELDPGNVGVGVRLNLDARSLPASIVLVFSKEQFSLFNIDIVRTLLMDAAAQIERALASSPAAPPESAS